MRLRIQLTIKHPQQHLNKIISVTSVGSSLVFLSKTPNLFNA